MARGNLVRFSIALLGALALAAPARPSGAERAKQPKPTAERAGPATIDPEGVNADVVILLDALNDTERRIATIARQRARSMAVRMYATTLLSQQALLQSELDELRGRRALVGTELSQRLLPELEEHAEGALAEFLRSEPADIDVAFLEHELDVHARAIQLVETELFPAVEDRWMKDLLAGVHAAMVGHRAAAGDLLVMAHRHPELFGGGSEGMTP